MKMLKSLLNEKYVFILINLGLSAIAFLRSFIFMKYLDLFNLGIISVIQTIVLFVGLLQFGFINGGYRIIAKGNNKELIEINNVIYSFFGLLCIFISLLIVLFSAFNYTFEISAFQLLYAAIIGLLTITSNWIVNVLLAKQFVSKLNFINFLTCLFVLLSFPLISFFGIWGCLISLLIQPLAVVFLSLFLIEDMRPSAFNFKLSIVTKILSIGFIPFLTGIFTLVNAQIERWSIVGALGIESLGRFYLVFIYSSLFSLIPSSLLNLIYPKAILYYESQNIEDFKKLISRYIKILILYFAIIAVGTFFLLSPFINYFLPKHSQYIKYVYYILPGLFLISLTDPIALIFQTIIRLKPILITYLTSVIINVLLIGGLFYCSAISLDKLAIIRSLVGFAIFVLYYIYYLKYRKGLLLPTVIN